MLIIKFFRHHSFLWQEKSKPAWCDRLQNFLVEGKISEISISMQDMFRYSWLTPKTCEWMQLLSIPSKDKSQMLACKRFCPA